MNRITLNPLVVNDSAVWHRNQLSWSGHMIGSTYIDSSTDPSVAAVDLVSYGKSEFK
jgi:hypothetical protein